MDFKILEVLGWYVGGGIVQMALLFRGIREKNKYWMLLFGFLYVVVNALFLFFSPKTAIDFSAPDATESLAMILFSIYNFGLLFFIVLFGEHFVTKINERILLVLTILVNYLYFAIYGERIMQEGLYASLATIVVVLMDVLVLFLAFSKKALSSFFKGVGFAWYSISMIFLMFISFAGTYLQFFDAGFSVDALLQHRLEVFSLGFQYVYFILHFVNLMKFFPGKREKTQYWKERMQNFLSNFSDKQMFLFEAVIIIVIMLIMIGMSIIYKLSPVHFIAMVFVGLSFYERFHEKVFSSREVEKV